MGFKGALKKKAPMAEAGAPAAQVAASQPKGNLAGKYRAQAAKGLMRRKAL